LDSEEKVALVAQLLAQTALIEEQRIEIARLRVLVAELSEKLGQNSRNSHLPPSSDGPGGARKHGGQKKKSGRKKGGQKGHRGRHRELLPEAQVDTVVDLFPKDCEGCSRRLPEVSDVCASRSQVTEVPPIRPHTTEFRQHAVTCVCCGHTTRATGVGIIPVSPFGPRLMGMVGLLTGVYHLSRRRAGQALNDILGVRISLGAVSSIEARVADAIEPAVAHAWASAHQAEVKHTDATAWLSSGVARSLWTIATSTVTVFKILADGSAKTVGPLFAALKGILISDRATVFSFWAMKQRQICWAHLLRKFVAFSERGDTGRAFGLDLLSYAGLVFEYWHAYRDGTLDKATFQSWINPVRLQFEICLRRAVAANIRHVSGSCADILKHQEALWTFVERDDVEPTNNHAERELRQFVMWRKRSFGTQSDRGNLFAERVMTVSHTARKQNINVLAFLTACCQALQTGAVPPLLIVAPL
jgi:transposase